MQAQISHSRIAANVFARYTGGMTLNLRIRPIRKDRGLTIAQLAERIGVSTAHLSEVERGVKNVNNHLLERLAAALSVKPEDLIASAESRDVIALSAILEQLSPEDRERVQAFAQALALAPKA